MKKEEITKNLYVRPKIFSHDIYLESGLANDSSTTGGSDGGGVDDWDDGGEFEDGGDL